jgi:hypothetical protein
VAIEREPIERQYDAVVRDIHFIHVRSRYDHSDPSTKRYGHQRHRRGETPITPSPLG